MRIDCHVPITVRIVGVPTDDQLAAVGRALTRAVTARLAEAERVLTDRHGHSGGVVSEEQERYGHHLGNPDTRTRPATAPADTHVLTAAAVGATPPIPDLDAETALDDRTMFSLASASDDSAPSSTVDTLAAGQASPGELSGHRSPGVARLDAAALHRDEQRPAMARQEESPDQPLSPPTDPLADALREARRTPPPPAPEPILPGDLGQQRHAIEKVDPVDLWLQPRVQEAIRRLAEYMQNWERGRPHPNLAYDAEYWIMFWGQRFTASVQYILYYRTDKRAVHLARLKAAEEAVLKQTPTAGHEGAAENTFRAVGLSLRIEALRQAARAAWLSDVDRAVDSFLVLAENQAKFLTVKQKAEPVLVTGLPSFEPVVKPAAAPDQLEKDSVGSAQSVVTFVRAVQRQWHGHLIKAGNYGGHELGNPHYGNVEFLGKFSFDVDLGSFAKVREDGFYEHDPVVDFFLAVERASAETNIGWLALYNDFAVAKEVNEQIGEFRIGFSGGGSPIKAPPEKEGSLHHGPAPYILHIHFNIMVRQPAAMLLRDKDARRINLGFTGDQ